jgi:uncharacterized membrane-anchored protein YhcB (DUF1043 family)
MVGAVCFDFIGYGNLGIITLIALTYIVLSCYCEDLKDQNKELKNELDTVNKKLDVLSKQLKDHDHYTNLER